MMRDPKRLLVNFELRQRLCQKGGPSLGSSRPARYSAAERRFARGRSTRGHRLSLALDLRKRSICGETFFARAYQICGRGLTFSNTG